MRFLKVYPRQADVLRFVGDYLETAGYPPSYAEIGTALGVASGATVHQHVHALVRKGYLEQDPHARRGLQLTALGLRWLARTRRGATACERADCRETVAALRREVHRLEAELACRGASSAIATRTVVDTAGAAIETLHLTPTTTESLNLGKAKL